MRRPQSVSRVPPPRMTLGRHARHYLLIGGVQWLVDWGVLVLLSHWGMAIELGEHRWAASPVRCSGTGSTAS